MNIFIVNCHWNNRGDEAAIRAMIDELHDRYMNAMIYVQKANGMFVSFPETDYVKAVPSSFPAHTKRRRVLDMIAYNTNGLVCFTTQQKAFFRTLKKADLVLHGPGGPSIGDLYIKQEEMKLKRLNLIRRNQIPYIFYAPSMGPFNDKERNPLRKIVLENAALICLREEQSYKMLKEFLPNVEPIVTLDSAFQHQINKSENERKYDDYQELKEFIDDGSQVIGITVTDLQWHAKFRDDGITAQNIRSVFSEFISFVTNQGYKVLFIPQLFGEASDFNYMSSFAMEGCFVMDDKHDCYFQQFVIGKLKAVVGMRYHSNIFSAKMGTPFISVSYEQKMEGFMKKAGLTAYCINISDLSFPVLQEAFESMMKSYNEYKNLLTIKREIFRTESRKTTDLVGDYIDNHIMSANKKEIAIDFGDNKKCEVMHIIKRHVKKTIRAFREKIDSIKEYHQDRKEYENWQYNKHGLKAKSALEGKILRQTHTIEKGMSIENPREKFGVQKALELLDFIDEYQRCGYKIEDSKAVCNSIGVIGAYLDYHNARGFVPEEVKERYELIKKYVPKSDEPFGVRAIDKKELEQLIHSEFPEFFASRHSVRQFQQEPIDIEVIRKSVRLAMHAPSACNRQSCHIYYYSDKEVNSLLAKMIAGNTGFEQDPSNYLVITSDMSCFHDTYERNQVYVDGGIMIMALIEALHYYGIASCVLQNGEYAKKNSEIKEACGNIPPNEKIICFIAIGYYKDHVVFATSHRKDLSDVLIEQ